MSSIESRILEMRFDNEQFEGAAKESLETLSALKNSLDSSITTDAFDELDRAARAVDLSGIQAGIEVLTDRFSTLGIVGMRVIENLTDGLMNTLRRGLNYVTDTIVSGGYQRAQNIEQARFQLQGLIGEAEDADKKVQDVMDAAMKSVNDTAYGFDEAAKAASMFYASGVQDGESMEKALSGIAGVAATTSSDYESMSRIFTTVAGNGRLMGDQLLQLSTRGLNAAATLKDYFNGVNSGAIEASENVTNLIAKLTGNSAALTASSGEVVQSMDEQYEAAQEALDKEYQAKKKSYDAQYKELQKMLNKEYNAKKAEYDKSYSALQEQLSNELEAVKEANSERLEAANNAYQAEVEAHQKATNEKIKQINEEYTESIKLIDEERYNRIKAIDDQIKAINDQAEAEQKAKELSEEATKRADIQKIIDSAKNAKTRKQAEEVLAQFEAEVAEKRLKEQRQENIEALNEEKTKINEEANLKKQEAAEKKSAAVESVQEESNATLKAMAENHKKEIAALQAQQKENIKAIQEANKLKLAELKASQGEELEAYNESQNLQLEQLKEFQNEELSSIQKANKKRLKELKEALKEEQGLTKTYGNGLEVTEQDIRDMVSKGLISFDIFSEAMSTTFGDHAQKANRTFTGAMANVGAAFKRIGEMFYSPLIAEGGPMVDLFNKIQERANDLKKALQGPMADVVNVVIDGIKKLTEWVDSLDIAVYKNVWDGEKWEKQYDHMGHTMETVYSVVKGLVNIFKAVGSVIKPIMEAFNEVFNPNLRPLDSATTTFEQFTESLILSQEQSDKLKSTFVTLFEILQQVGRIGASVFETLRVAIKGVYDVLSPVVDFILSIFGIKTPKDVGDFFVGISEGIRDFLSGIEVSVISTEKIREKLTSIYEIVRDVFGGLWRIVSPLMEPLKKVGESLLNILRSADPIKAFFSTLNAFFVSDLILNLHKIIDQFDSLIKVPTSISKKFGKMLNNININLQAFAISTDAGALKDIAISIALLAASMFVLASLDGDALARSLIAITVLLGEVMAVYYAFTQIKFPALERKEGIQGIFDSISALGDSLRKSAVAASLFMIAGSVLLLVAAVAKLGKLKPDQLIAGFIAASLLLWEMVAVLEVIDKMGGPEHMAAIGVGLLLIAAAVNVLTKSVIKLSEMDYESLIKGLVAVGVILLELGLFTKGVGGAEKMFSIGLGLFVIAEAVKVLAKTVTMLSQLSWEDVAKGLVSIGVLLLELGLFVTKIGTPEALIKTSIGIFIIAEAIKVIGNVITKLAELDWNGVAKGLVSIAVALFAMCQAIAYLDKNVAFPIEDAAALIVLGLALEIIADVIIKIAALDWNGVAKGLVAILGSLAVISYIADELPKDIVGKSMGLIVLGLALQIIADVIIKIADLDWNGVAKGLVGILGSLLIISKIGGDLPDDMIVKSLGLIVLGAALEIIADVLIKLSVLSWDEMIRGLTGMGMSLLEFGLALNALKNPTVLTGAAAIMIMAIAMRILTPALLALGELGWEQVGVALAAMGGALVELGGIATALGTVAPLALAGAGVLFAFALSLTASIGMISTVIPKFVEAVQMMSEVDHEEFMSNVKVLAEAFSEFGKALDDFSIFSKIGADAMKICAEAIEILVDPMKEFIKLDNDELKETFKVLSDAFGDFGKALKNFGLLAKNGASAMVTVADAINKLVPGMIIFSILDPERLANAFDVLAKAFGDFGNALHEFGILSGVGANAMVKVANAISKMAPGLVMISTIQPKKLSKELEELGKGFDKFGEALDEYDIFSGIGASAILKLAEAVNKLAPSLMMLSAVPADRLSSTIRNLGYAFRSFAKALDEVPFWGATSRAEGIGALIDNISNLTDVLPPFIELDQRKVRKGLKNLGDGFKAFGEALDATPYWGSEKRAEGIGALIENVSSLTEVLPGFIELDADDAKTALDTIGQAFKDFGEALEKAPFWGVEDRGEAIKTLVSSIDELGTGLNTFITLLDGKDDQVASALDTISGAFVQFGLDLNSAPFFNADDRGQGIKHLAESVIRLAVGLKYFIEELDEDEASSALEMIGNAFKTFGEALDATPFIGTKTRTMGIRSLIRAIKDLADNLQYFIDTVDTSKSGDVLGSLGQAFKDFGDAIHNSPFWKSKDRAAALVSIIDSIGGLAEPLNQIAEIPTDTLASILTSLEAMFISFGDTLNDMRTGATVMASALTSMVNSIGVFAGIDTEKLGIAIAQVKSFVNVLEGILQLDSTKMDGVSTSLTTLSEGAIKAFSNKFSTMLPDVEKAVGGMLSAVNNKISEYHETFYNQGISTVTKYLLGMMFKSNDAEKIGESVVNKAVNGLNSEKALSDMYKAGQNAIQGFIDGMNDKLKDVEDAGTDLGNAAYWAAKKSLDEKSPSKKMAEVGSFAGEGFVNGFLDWIKAATNAGGDIGESAQEGLKNALNNIGSEIQNDEKFNPTITPVLDLSEVQKNASAISGMLNLNKPITLAANAGMSFTGGLNNLLSNIQASIPDNTNEDVVTAINGLRSDMYELGRKVTNLQVVMDSGELVGVLTDPIDEQIGFKTKLAERGVM